MGRRKTCLHGADHLHTIVSRSKIMKSTSHKPKPGIRFFHLKYTWQTWTQIITPDMMHRIPLRHAFVPKSSNPCRLATVQEFLEQPLGTGHCRAIYGTANAQSAYQGRTRPIKVSRFQTRPIHHSTSNLDETFFGRCISSVVILLQHVVMGYCNQQKRQLWQLW